MGSFFSTLPNPDPAGAAEDGSAGAAEDGSAGAAEDGSAVLAVHSKQAWDEHWTAHKSTNKLLVIDFSATWCGPCRFIEPFFKALAGRFPQASFVKIDVDELSEVARQWDVEAMPTFVLVKGGKEVDRVVGAGKDELEKKVPQLV